MMSDLIYSNLSGLKPPPGFIKRATTLWQRIAKLSGKKWGQVSLVLVKPEDIRRLNKVYRRRDRVTDVLSFLYQKRPVVEGEIVICLAQAKRQSQIFGSRLRDELEFLFVHGCLHLLGYNHHKTAERKKMESMSGKILGRNRLGIKIK